MKVTATMTWHMIRLRHVSQITGAQANEIVLLNSHNDTSSYQMLAGMFRFVCSNGLVCGDTVAEVRVPHKGDVAGQVIEGAYEVLQGFERVRDARDSMRAITLDEGDAQLFARSALALKYDDPNKPAPITENQILMPRRFDDRRPDLMRVFNRAQENLTKGGIVRPGCQWSSSTRALYRRLIPIFAWKPRFVAFGRWHAPVESLKHSSGRDRQYALSLFFQMLHS